MIERIVFTVQLIDMYKKTDHCFEHTEFGLSGGQADVQQLVENVGLSISQDVRLVEKIE